MPFPICAIRSALIAIPLPIRQPYLLSALTSARFAAIADVLTVSTLVTIGLLVSWPNLFNSPPFPAVGGSIDIVMRVIHGRGWPLADQSPYLGAPFVYLLACVYLFFGPSLESTMLLAWLVGGLTVIPVYFLGKEVAGRYAGLVAAALLVTSPAHIVITSHVPWVHSLTPLCTALSLWLLVRAVNRREVRLFWLAGLCIGVTLQTHPTALPLLVGGTMTAIIWRREWRQARMMACFVAFVILGYAPLLVNHVQSHFQVIDDIQGKQERYLDVGNDIGEDASGSVYLTNLELLSSSLVRLTSGELLDDRPGASEYLRDPRLIAYPILGITGLMLAPKRSGWLLLVGLALGVLAPPLLNGKYKPVLDGRYLMPLVPVVFVGIGALVSTASRRLATLRLQPVLMMALVALTTGLVLTPLAALDRFYEATAEDGANNQLYLRTLAIIREQRQSDESVWLDPKLHEVKMQGGGATAGSTLEWLLLVSGIPVSALPPDADPSSLAGHLLIVQRSAASALRQKVELRHLDGSNVNGRDQQNYRLVRIGSADRCPGLSQSDGSCRS